MDNTIREKKLPFTAWKKYWEKGHCRECDVGIPNPLVCYVCVLEQWHSFRCAKCQSYIFLSEKPVCAGLFATGECLCVNCQAIIQQVKVCHEYSRAGYSVEQLIHKYSAAEISREIKLFFRGENLWAKILCRFCEKRAVMVKLGCFCYKEQKKHDEHKYSSSKCLDCYRGYWPQKLDEKGWKKIYREYCEEWKWRQELDANKNIRGAYQFYGVGGGYWAKCSFCDHLIKGQETHKKPLEKNLVQFWSRDNKDGRLICDYCLTRREIVWELGIEKKIVSYWLRQGFIRCEICARKLEAAGKHSTPKNRNRAFDFWKLSKIREKILCLLCIKEKYREQLFGRKRRLLNEYLKRGYV